MNALNIINNELRKIEEHTLLVQEINKNKKCTKKQSKDTIKNRKKSKLARKARKHSK